MKASIIFPIHLISNNPLLKFDNIIVYEHPKMIKGHKAKRALLIKSLKNYISKYTYSYFNDLYTFDDILNKKIKEIYIFDPCDKDILKELKSICEKKNIKLTIYESPLFVHNEDSIKEYLKDHLFHHKSFYEYTLKSLLNSKELSQEVYDILKVSTDKYNRDPFTINDSNLSKEDLYKHFTKNKEKDMFSDYPTTRKSALLYLNDFMKDRLNDFAKYQDAIGGIGYHSFISALLNIGLLTPKDIIVKIDTYKNNPNIEAFIRQVLGWREYIRMCYVAYCKGILHIKDPFNCHNKIDKSFWSIEPINNIYIRINEFGYCQHIERLMVLGNWFLLNEIDPNIAYDWFMDNFIDAYEWVMIANLYGMVYHALVNNDNKSIMKKPYICSFNYIEKHTIKALIDNKSKTLWNDKYHIFIKKHKTFLSQFPIFIK